MGQTHLWPQIGPIRVHRPVPGLIFHETDTRNLIFLGPGAIGGQNHRFWVGGVGGPCMLMISRARQTVGGGKGEGILLGNL